MKNIFLQTTEFFHEYITTQSRSLYFVDYKKYLDISREIKLEIIDLIENNNFNDVQKLMLISSAHHIILDLYKIAKISIDLYQMQILSVSRVNNNKTISIYDLIENTKNIKKNDFFFSFGNNKIYSSKNQSLKDYVKYLTSKLNIYINKNGGFFLDNNSNLLQDYLTKSQVNPFLLRAESWYSKLLHNDDCGNISEEIRFRYFKLLNKVELPKKIISRACDIIHYLIIPKLNYSRMYIQVCERLKLSNLNHSTLLGSSPQIIGKILNFFIKQNCSNKVIRFAHGGDRVFFSDYYWGISELPFVDQYYVHSSKEKKSLETKLQKKIIYKFSCTLNIKSNGSKKHREISNHFSKKNKNKKNKILFVPGTFTNDEHLALPEFKVNDTLIADYQYYLISAIKNLGYELSIKVHPGQINKNIFFKKFGCKLIFDPFDILVNNSKILMFDFAGSAFFDSLASDKGIVLLDTNIRPHFKETFSDLRKRCSVVNCYFNSSNRIRFKEKDLSRSIEKAIDFDIKKTGFLEKYF